MPVFSGAQNISDSQSLNLYTYVGNRPLYYTDPLGLYWYDDVGDVSAGFGDVVSLGLTKNLRGVLSDYYDMSDTVDPCSGYYTAGKWSGYAWWALTVSGANNSNRYLRWGWGKYKGKPNFRIAGDWLKWKNNPHINLWPPKYWSR